MALELSLAPSVYMSMMGIIVAVTGHRPQHLLEYDSPEANVKDFYRRVLTKLKPDKLISGMALGVDQWAASVALELGVSLTAAIPYSSQARFWTAEQTAEYQLILERASEIEILFDNPISRYESYRLLQKRNEWMVDNSRLLVGVWRRGRFGGTMNCINYARRVGQRMIVIDPIDWRITKL